MKTVQGHPGAVRLRGSFLFFATLSLAHTGVLIYFSLLHSVPTIPGDSDGWSLQVDRQLLMHIGAYALLFGWLHATFLRAPRRSLRAKCIALALTLACGLGLILELWQLVVPGRAFDWGDVVANVAGATAAALLVLVHAVYVARQQCELAEEQR